MDGKVNGQHQNITMPPATPATAGGGINDNSVQMHVLEIHITMQQLFFYTCKMYEFNTYSTSSFYTAD